ncbi:MAG TPA: SDR family oxidoreductase [Thermoanaerobaculia bacterium]|nr:SDR family oxidoreductase [Thermoanaerobaculia bacterium]
MKETALITGASSGIGLDLARLFAKDGHDVVLVARSEGRLREIAAELERDCGIKAHVIAADLAQPDAPRKLVDALPCAIDILVNNAGFGITGPFVTTDLAKELEMIQVNVVALTALTKLLLPPMVARRRGRVLNVASTAAFQPGPLMAVYYATKAYVLSFSEAIADELRDSGVTVTALCPGPTSTGFADAAGMTKTRLFNLAKPMDSAAVAREGYKAMQRGRRVVVTGMKNKLLTQSIRVSPRRMVTAVVRKLQESRQ